MPSIGRLGDPSAVRSPEFDDVCTIYVVDGVLSMRPAAFELFTADVRTRPTTASADAKSHDLSARNASLRSLGGWGRHNSR